MRLKHDEKRESGCVLLCVYTCHKVRSDENREELAERRGKRSEPE